ncbi:hypothetical protein [Streptomyces avicenniae]|uniref:hypothetical protein n=1 Tax=Streptomyces avicenniae TaxID=500153 RepID=UPI00069B4A2F|nr:hypothetical protein [Streptomyces avicenniae]
METTTTVYRHLAGPWGLYVRLTAGALTGPPPPDGVPVTDRLSLRVREPHAVEDDLAFLHEGLRHVAPAVTAAAGAGHVTVTVERFLYPLTDHQPEAMALAVLQWAAEHFGFPVPPSTVTFDRTANRYTVTLS